MGFRFRRSVKIAPGIRLNFSKSGVSTSLGGRGATVNLSKRGTRHTVGLPGTGVSYSTFTPKNGGGGGKVSGTTTTDSNRSFGCGCVVLIGALILLLSQCGSSEETERQTSSPLTLATASGDIRPASGDALLYEPNETVYVTADSLNGRSEPSTSGRVVTSLPRGSSLTVIDRSGDWLKVSTEAATVWVAAAHVSSHRPPQRLYSAPAKSNATPRSNYSDGNCPCSGSRVCVGPRGGRYCITTGGNKRYGV